MTTITKKSIIENLAACKDWTKEEINELWNDIKENGFAGKYRSEERLNNFWNRYAFYLSDNFLN